MFVKQDERDMEDVGNIFKIINQLQSIFATF